MQTERQKEMAGEALTRARSGQSLANEAITIQEFVRRGISVDDIQPRVNVLTFWAWKALNRSVRKGEHGVKLTTWIPYEKKDGTEGLRPKTCVVFHVSQTDPIGAQSDFKLTDPAPAKSDPIAPKQSVNTNSQFEYFSDEFKQVG